MVVNGVRKTIASGAPNAQALRDIGEVKGFIQGDNIVTGFELFWSPVFFLVLFIVHPIIGFIGVAAAIVMVMMGYMTELTSRKSLSKAGAKHLAATMEVGNSLRNAEAVDGMGMGDRIITTRPYRCVNVSGATRGSPWFDAPGFRGLSDTPGRRCRRTISGTRDGRQNRKD